jgi:hypothetical protein
MQAGLPFLLYKEEYAGVVSDFQGCIFPRIRGREEFTTGPRTFPGHQKTLNFAMADESPSIEAPICAPAARPKPLEAMDAQALQNLRALHPGDMKVVDAVNEVFYCGWRKRGKQMACWVLGQKPPKADILSALGECRQFFTEHQIGKDWWKILLENIPTAPAAPTGDAVLVADGPEWNKPPWRRSLRHWARLPVTRARMPLRVPLAHAPDVLLCCMLLHNLCVEHNSTPPPINGADLPDTGLDDALITNDEVQPPPDQNRRRAGHSLQRDFACAAVSSAGLQRPTTSTHWARSTNPQ